MNRRSLALTILGAAFVVCFAGIGMADDKDDKSKSGPSLDDRTSMLTETVDGKDKTSKVDLKYNLKVKGVFTKDGLKLDEIDEDGPAHKLTNDEGTPAYLEPGDVIREIDGKAIKSADDYVKALNGASDHEKVKIKVRDVRTGDDQVFYANSNKL
jgi:hypothetical protein